MAFPFGTSQKIDVAYAIAQATRMTYVGELGWELMVPTEFAQSLYVAIMVAGKDFDIANAVYHALNSLRQEKAYRHWGHDITDEETPVEAGLSFSVDFTKASFNGKARLVAQKENGVTKRLVQFALEDEKYMLYHNEPIWRDDKIVGHLTSAMFGHTVGAACGMGYISQPEPVTAEFVKAGSYEIEVATVRVPARASLRGFYDPKSERVRM